MLYFIKGIDGEWEDIICSTDWSEASFIIFAQSLGLISSSLSDSNRSFNADILTSYIIKIIFLGILPSIYLYFKMHTDPEAWAAWGQIFMFSYAFWRFFIDGRKAQILSNSIK